MSNYDLDQAHTEGVVAACKWITELADEISTHSTLYQLRILEIMHDNLLQSGYPTTATARMKAVKAIRGLITTAAEKEGAA